MNFVPDLHMFPRLLAIASYFKAPVLAALLFSTIANFLMLTPSLYMLQVFDRVMLSRSEITLVVLSAITAFLYFLLVFFEWVQGKVLVKVSHSLDKQLSALVFEANFIDRLNKREHNAMQTVTDLNTARSWLSAGGLATLFDVPWVPIYALVMFILNPVFGLISLVFIGVLILISRITIALTHSSNEHADDEEKDLNKLIQNKLKNIDVITVHGMQQGLQDKWWERLQISMVATFTSEDRQNRMTAVSKQVRLLMQSLTLAVGAMLVIKGSMGVGTMITASILMNRVTAPIDKLVSSWKTLVMVQQAFVRLEDLLKNVSTEKSNFFQDITGNLSLDAITVKVAGREKPILDNISLALEAGHIYALVGPSGSGKSTLGKVLLDIWPSYQGDVTLDGVLINRYDRKKLGACLGYLPQDVELFSGTIADNIARFGELDSSKVIHAAGLAWMYKAILRMPNGFETEIGEAGKVLSGGQRQRIALARALYGLPKLVVLDEPDANLDQTGQRALISAMQTLKKEGSTVVLITHQTEILDVVDTVIELEAGRIKQVISSLAFRESNTEN